MKYEKPELVPIARAIEVISTHQTKLEPCSDNSGIATCTAYEADE